MSQYGCISRLSTGPMPMSRWSIQNKLKGIFEGLCFSPNALSGHVFSFSQLI